MSKIGKELTTVPLEDLIAGLGLGIAKAQLELDKNSTKVAQLMSGINDEDKIFFNGQKLSLIELGFTPTFYQFVESTIEVKIVVNMTTSKSSSSNTKSKPTKLPSSGWWFSKSEPAFNTTTVDAKYAKKYDYSAEGSSMIRTKLVPVPPPAILDKRIQKLMEEDAIRRVQEKQDS